MSSSTATDLPATVVSLLRDLDDLLTAATRSALSRLLAELRAIRRDLVHEPSTPAAVVFGASHGRGASPAPVTAGASTELLRGLDRLRTDIERSRPGGPGPRMRLGDVAERLDAMRDQLQQDAGASRDRSSP